MPVANNPVLFAVLCVNTALGCILVAGAHDLRGLVLGWAGWVGGAVGVGALGWLVIPEVIGGGIALRDRLGATIALVVVGAVIGRLLVPLAVRVSVAIVAVLCSTLATLVVIVGESILGAVYDPVDPSNPTLNAVEIEGIAETGLLTQPDLQQAVIVSVIVGSVAGVLAIRYYDIVITVALTGLGAGLLATIAPVWRAVVAGQPIAITAQADLSPGVFVAVLVIGVGIQSLRQYRKANS